MEAGVFKYSIRITFLMAENLSGGVGIPVMACDYLSLTLRINELEEIVAELKNDKNKTLSGRFKFRAP